MHIHHSNYNMEILTLILNSLQMLFPLQSKEKPNDPFKRGIVSILSSNDTRLWRCANTMQDRISDAHISVEH